MTIKEIRALTRLTQKQFAEKYHITFSSIRNWEGGHRICPEYVKELLEFRVREDLKMINADKYNTFLKPERPFLLIYTDGDTDEVSYSWTESEEELREVIAEVTSYGCKIQDAIEIGSLREIKFEQLQIEK